MKRFSDNKCVKQIRKTSSINNNNYGLAKRWNYRKHSFVVMLIVSGFMAVSICANSLTSYEQSRAIRSRRDLQGNIRDKKIATNHEAPVEMKGAVLSRQLPDLTDEENVFYEENKLDVFFSDIDDSGLLIYEHCDDLIMDVQQALASLANIQIKDEMDGKHYYENMWTTDPMEDSNVNENSFDTNNQFDDVDEADVVKSDGTFIYNTYGSSIIVSDLNGNEKYRLNATSTEKNLRTAKLLLYQNYLVVFLAYFDVTTEIALIDINLSNGQLSIKERKMINGSYKTARLIDSNIHIVTKSSVDFTDQNFLLSQITNEGAFYYLDSIEYAEVAFDLAATMIPKFAIGIVQQILDTSDIDSVSCNHVVKLSSYLNGMMEEEDIMSSIAEIFAGFVRINSFDVTSGFENIDISGTFVSLQSDIHINRKILFVGGKSGSTKTAPEDAVTYVTAFELDGPSSIPSASGIIPGYPNDQFSYDFHNNYLRVATTRGSYNSATRSTNQVVVAKIENNQINIVSTLEGIGDTEVIYAVRFFGDRAFIVTFREVDPFYIIDMSIPEAPTIQGELKIPGYSNYLHPVDENYVLAVGQDVDEKEGTLLGLQVALFDVTDLSNPKQIAKHVVEGWSSSESQKDHRAFRYLASSKKLILPISRDSRNDDDSFDGFYVYNVELRENGITRDFIISHYESTTPSPACYSSSYLIPRSLIFQGNVVTLKGHTIQSHNLASKEKIWEKELDTNLNSENKCYKWFGEESLGGPMSPSPCRNKWLNGAVKSSGPWEAFVTLLIESCYVGKIVFEFDFSVFLTGAPTLTIPIPVPIIPGFCK